MLLSDIASQQRKMADGIAQLLARRALLLSQRENLAEDLLVQQNKLGAETSETSRQILRDIVENIITQQQATEAALINVNDMLALEYVISNMN